MARWSAIIGVVTAMTLAIDVLGAPSTPEALFEAYSDAVRQFSPKQLLSLNDEETREVWVFLMGNEDPLKHPKYARIEKLPEVLRGWRESAQRHFEKVPPDVIDPNRRLELALLERLKAAGEGFCRSFDGTFEHAEDVSFIKEAPPGTRLITFRCGPKRSPFSFCAVPTSSGWKISHYYTLVWIAYGYRVVDALAPKR